MRTGRRRRRRGLSAQHGARGPEGQQHSGKRAKKRGNPVRPRYRSARRPGSRRPTPPRTGANRCPPACYSGACPGNGCPRNRRSQASAWTPGRSKRLVAIRDGQARDARQKQAQHRERQRNCCRVRRRKAKPRKALAAFASVLFKPAPLCALPVDDRSHSVAIAAESASCNRRLLATRRIKGSLPREAKF